MCGAFILSQPRLLIVCVAATSYYFDIVVQNEIVFLAMADKGISDIEVAHRFLKDVIPK
jgi:hypothetical protein|eukprot:COSAG01_NODE_1839_length_9079_cov_16.478731_6_plen_59_part_00